MEKIVVLFATLFVLIKSSMTGDSRYCATFAESAQGYFAIEIGGQGSWAKYSFNIDTAKSSALDDCKLDDGLKYHIHMDWNSTYDSSVDRTAGGVCSKTGAHYDPNYACGPASYYYATKCEDLGRKGGSYKYDCATEFSKGDYASCEIGDLSGKFGVVKVNTSAKISSNGHLFDPLPPYAFNFDNPLVEEPGNAWKSLVFHCNTDTASGVRILCARFKASTSDDICHKEGAFGGTNNGTDGGKGHDECANCKCGNSNSNKVYSSEQFVTWVIISIILTSCALGFCALVGGLFESKQRTKEPVVTFEGIGAIPPDRTDAIPPKRTDAIPPERTDAIPPERTENPVHSL